MRADVVVPLVIFLLICQIGIVREGSTGELETSSDWIPSSVVVENCIEDPYLDSEPGTIINGISGEFSSNYHQAVDEEDINYMELTWTHVANTSLEFIIGEDDDLPDCIDFIYFYQWFDWTSNRIPLDAEFHFNYSTTLTGSFATEDYGNLMFRVYVWMIDSSGDWIRVYESREALYSEVYQEKTVNFNYFDLQRTWGGMIENSSGYQEDPADIVQVAIGLAPIHNFETFHMYEDDPWEFYDGTVSVRVNNMELWVYMEEDPDPSQVLLPLYNKTWEYSARDVFPDVPEEYEDVRERFNDIETGADGSVYVLCDASTSYEYYIQSGNHFASQFLLKYNSRLESLWSKALGNRTHGHAMTLHDNHVYTTGYVYTSDTTGSKDLIVTKWTPNGDIVWQTQWGGIYDEEGSAIAVSSDGSIYVWSVYYNLRFEPEFWKSSFLKFDSSGTLLWNRTSVVPLLPGIAELEPRPDGLYSWDSAYLEKRNFTCELVWNISRPAFAVNFDEIGNIYIATLNDWGGPGGDPDHWQVTISKWSSSGIELWHSNYSIQLPDETYLNFECRVIDVAPDGSVLTILHEMHFTHDYHMLKFDSTGSFLWDKLIGDERWPPYTGIEPQLEMGRNGLAYVGVELFGYVGVGITAYVVGPYNTGTNLQTMLIVGISGVSLAAIAIVFYIRKYR